MAIKMRTKTIAIITAKTDFEGVGEWCMGALGDLSRCCVKRWSRTVTVSQCCSTLPRICSRPASPMHERMNGEDSCMPGTYPLPIVV